MEKIENNIELVSLHIPKTAGTSFRNILKKQYKKKQVCRLDIYPSGDIELNEKKFTDTVLKNDIKVIHGHFSFKKINTHFELATNTPFITWLRDPVERVISNYFFLKKIISDRLQETPNENLFNRMGKTLKEFVVQEETQNVMSKFIHHSELENFKFIGIQDDFNDELKRLEKIMGWDNIKPVYDNITDAKAQFIDDETIELIRLLNKDDIQLYHKGLEINQKRNLI